MTNIDHTFDLTHAGTNPSLIDIQQSYHERGGLFIRLRSEDWSETAQGHITREDLAKVLPELVKHVEDHKPVLPTREAAVIRANVSGGESSTRAVQGLILTRLSVESPKGQNWRGTENAGVADFYRDNQIVSFEVLFEGVEAS